MIKDPTLLDKIGPCGILCEKCFAFHQGQIRYHAIELKNNLGAFDAYADRFVTLLNEPAFSKYQDFKELLNLLCSSNCIGCRKQKCYLFTNCIVKNCHKERKVDFCFQCDRFPCDSTGFDDNLKMRWLKINNRIREVGIVAYYTEIKDKPRY